LDIVGKAAQLNETIKEQQHSSAPTDRLKRIVVVGDSGAGKTVLARQLARRLDLLHIELDALFWEANWTQAAPEVFRERVRQALCAERWVVDGNYSQVGDLTWARADTVVWLDYGLGTILIRLLLRTFRRIFTREELWNGNRESFFKGLFTRDSIIVWAITTYSEKRRRYLAAQVDPTYAHIEIIRLRTPHDTQVWLSRLPV
jgi:adenylate kinase family enzyme